jgi:NADH-quinone oxidoreductase subunit N
MPLSPLAMFETGGLARFFTGLIGLVTGLSVLFLHHYAKDRGFAGDSLFGLVLWSGLGMLITATTTNWLTLLVGIELMSLCLYALIAVRREDRKGAEAALKYFLPGSVALASMLFGIGLIYAGTGSLDIMSTMKGGSTTGLAGLVLVLVGLAFKMSLAPLYLWTPDAYQGAPAPVAAFLSTGSKAAVAAVLLRLALAAGSDPASAVGPILFAATGLTMAVGNIAALCQRSLKRLLAYSSIAQMGYVAMAALAVAGGGAKAAMFYLAAYAVMELGAFGAVGLISPTENDRDDLEAYRGLGYAHPWRAGLLALSVLSLAGLPPTAGFTGKFLVFQAALQAHLGYLALFGIIMAVVGMFYYLRVVAVLYMRPAEAQAQTVIASPGLLAGLAALVVTVLILWLGVLPSGLMEVIAGLMGGK